MSHTRALAEYAVSGTVDELPPAVVAHTKTAILNSLGAALGGAATRIGQLHVNLARATGGGVDDASLIGGGKVSTAMAAYANASLAFALDYEDVVCYCIHAGPVTVPAALAVGEKLGSSGRELLVAVERGYEIGTRIGLSMQPSAERGGQVWGQQYTPFAPCVAAGRLLGLDAERMDTAMGITGTYATVPSAYKYFGAVDETRPMREAKLGWGWMSLGGVFGALSAAEGFRGGHGILDGDEGFWIMAGSDHCDHDVMTRDLGQTHFILETEFKVHPSIAWNHPPHIALKQLMVDGNFTASDVARVRVKGLGIARIADFKPSGAVDAMFSLPYTIATTLLGDPLLPAMYDDARITSADVRALLDRIECEADPDAELAWFNDHRMCFDIEVTLADERKFRVETEFPRDRPEQGHREIVAKFRELAAVLLPVSRADAIIDAVENLEQIDNVAMLAAMLSP
ncbi:MAG: MmgE/PrpD family protein [Gammaproteobacteria bacterium]